MCFLYTVKLPWFLHLWTHLFILFLFCRVTPLGFMTIISKIIPYIYITQKSSLFSNKFLCLHFYILKFNNMLNEMKESIYIRSHLSCTQMYQKHFPISHSLRRTCHLAQEMHYYSVPRMSVAPMATKFSRDHKTK